MFRWLARIFAAQPPIDLTGATLNGAAWEISAPRDPVPFVRNLPLILPPGSTLYLEDGSREMARELGPRCVPGTQKIALGTVWPRPWVLQHLPATPDNIAHLAELFDTHAAPEICIHFHAYHDGVVLLQWHDAFGKFPLYLSQRVPEDQVRAFCAACGTRYTPEVLPPE
jgi:hypothetical protein